MLLPYVDSGRTPLGIMAERPEPWTNDTLPIPTLQRTPLLSNSHGLGDPMRAVKKTLAFNVEDSRPHPGVQNSNIRRAISHRISRVATTTLGRSISESLRRARSASPSQRRIPDGNVRIRKSYVKDDSGCPSDSVSPPPADARVSSANDFSSRFAPAYDYDLAMQIEAVEQENGKSGVAEVPVPALLQQGVPMTKVSAKTQKSYLFKLDADQGQIIWESKKLRISMCFFFSPSVGWFVKLTSWPPTLEQFPSRTSRNSGLEPTRDTTVSSSSSHANTRIDGLLSSTR